MSPEEIKSECDDLYAKIREFNTRLEELRSICGLEQTVYGLYQERVGRLVNGDICIYCGKLVGVHGVGL